jgi:hypothetical protein
MDERGHTSKHGGNARAKLATIVLASRDNGEQGYAIDRAVLRRRLYSFFSAGFISSRTFRHLSASSFLPQAS